MFFCRWLFIYLHSHASPSIEIAFMSARLEYDTGRNLSFALEWVWCHARVYECAYVSVYELSEDYVGLWRDSNDDDNGQSA